AMRLEYRWRTRAKACAYVGWPIVPSSYSRIGRHRSTMGPAGHGESCRGDGTPAAAAQSEQARQVALLAGRARMRAAAALQRPARLCCVVPPKSGVRGRTSFPGTGAGGKAPPAGRDGGTLAGANARTPPLGAGNRASFFVVH